MQLPEAVALWQKAVDMAYGSDLITLHAGQRLWVKHWLPTTVGESLLDAQASVMHVGRPLPGAGAPREHDPGD